MMTNPHPLKELSYKQAPIFSPLRLSYLPLSKALERGPGGEVEISNTLSENPLKASSSA